MVRTKEWNSDWTGIPVLDPRAKPVFGFVTGAHVVFIARGSIRNAHFTGARFIVAGPKLHRTQRQKKPRVEVQCPWKGRKPPTTWMFVAYDTPPEEKFGYTGEVTTDFQ